MYFFAEPTSDYPFANFDSVIFRYIEFAIAYVDMVDSLLKEVFYFISHSGGRVRIFSPFAVGSAQ